MAELRNVKGLEEVSRRMREVPRQLQRKYLKVAVMVAAKVVRDEARRGFRAEWDVRTGRLVKNIVMKYIGEKSRGTRMTYYVLVKKVNERLARDRKTGMRKTRKASKSAGNPYYWRHLEFGTAHIRAKPFMRPAFEKKNQEAIDVMAAALKEAIRDMAQKGFR